MLATIRTALHLLAPGARRSWFALVPLALLAAGAEAATAGGLLALITVVGEPARVHTLPVVGRLAALLPGADDRTLVLLCTVVLLILALAKNALQGLHAWASSRLVADGMAELARRLLAGYLAVPYAFHLRRNSADLIRNVSSSVEMVFGAVLAPAVALAFEAIVVAAILVVLLAAAPLATLLLTALVGGASIVLMRASRAALERWGAREHALSGEILRGLQQTFGAIRELKLLGRERFFDEIFARTERELVEVRHRRATWSALPRLGLETLFVCGAFLLIALVVLSTRVGATVLPLLALYAYAGFRVIPSVNRIMLYLGAIRAGTAAVAQIDGDLTDLDALAAEAADGDGGEVAFAERIVFEGVSYAYEAGQAPVLRAVDLEIRRGETVGIVGPTGAGKSTLVDLLTGILRPSAGRVTVDGTDLRGRERAWQRRLGYVPQTIALIDDTVRRNVALGIGDAEVDEGRLREVIRAACLEEVVRALPRGLDTPVGERGVRLSGGERQRIGVARALYRRPEVLLLDEATAALDTRTETELLAAVARLPGVRTLIVVAHRMSTVQCCGRLVVVEGGRIADTGAYGDLLDRSPVFRRLAAGWESPSP
jgi:ATP-binding cassette subfamily C protein